MKAIAALLLPMLISIFISDALAYQVVSGTVFHDIDADGHKGRFEPGIPGVAVSNGVEVVLTDGQGKYTLPISEDAIIFVIKPGNFRYPVNEYNLPQFFYIHEPAGSPELAFQCPTDSLPEKVNFGLLTGSDSDKFSIIVFSDPHTSTPEEIFFYNRSIIDNLVGVEGFEFGVTLGDLVSGRLDYFEYLNRATSRIGLPWFHVFGNHDMNLDATETNHRDESFEVVYGPSTFAFNQGQVHFIILNNVIFPNTYTDWLFVGGILEEQFQFIENTLKYVPKDHLIVIKTHIPLFDEHVFGDTFIDEHRKRLFGLLKDRPYTFSLSGHTHMQRHYFFDIQDGWQGARPHHHYTVGAASGDWWSGKKDERGVPYAVMRDGSPKGYTFLHFDGNTYSWDYIAADKPDSFKLRIYGPRLVPFDVDFRGEFFVNFFQGSKYCRVDFKINGGEWSPMKLAVEQDPYISGLRYIWDHATVLPAGIRPSNPADCYHLWKVRVPRNLPLGTNTFYVRVTDKLGRIFTGQLDFEVVK